MSSATPATGVSGPGTERERSFVNTNNIKQRCRLRMVCIAFGVVYALGVVVGEDRAKREERERRRAQWKVEALAEAAAEEERLNNKFIGGCS